MIVAKHIYLNLYHEEKRINLPPIRTFDNGCASALQIAAGVLSKLDVIEFIDEIERRSVFKCEPDEFEDVILQNMDQGCDYDTVVLAVVRLAEYTPLTQEIVDCLSQLELCNPVQFKTTERKIPDWFAEKIGKDIPVLEVPDFRIEWTSKKEYYDELARNWVSLIQ